MAEENEHSIELPMLQMDINEQSIDGIVKSTSLTVKMRKYCECKRGMDYLIEQHKTIGKNKLSKKKIVKFKDRSIG